MPWKRLAILELQREPGQVMVTATLIRQLHRRVVQEEEPLKLGP
jgi:hypothetical protein